MKSDLLGHCNQTQCEVANHTQKGTRTPRPGTLPWTPPRRPMDKQAMDGRGRGSTLQIVTPFGEVTSEQMSRYRSNMFPSIEKYARCPRSLPSQTKKLKTHQAVTGLMCQTQRKHNLRWAQTSLLKANGQTNQRKTSLIHIHFQYSIYYHYKIPHTCNNKTEISKHSDLDRH